eukprot:2780208-Prymnesium_polylepis.1
MIDKTLWPDHNLCAVHSNSTGQQLKAAHRTSATLAGVESRPQAHQRLCAQRFRQAGWAIAADKIELDYIASSAWASASTREMTPSVCMRETSFAPRRSAE